MQTVDESTMDDVITTIDFATLFSQEELKAKRAEEKDRRKKNGILSVENSHFLIYLKPISVTAIRRSIQVPVGGFSLLYSRQNTLIPRYSIMQSLKWINTYQALIVPSIFTSFGIFLMRQSCAVIPNELIEAARMDGANEFYIFHRIIIPQLNNAIVSMSVFQFLWAWDDYLWPFLMIRDTEKQLLPVALNLFSGQYSTDYAGLFAATSIAIIPIVIFYIIFQKKFIAGVSSSAIKGEHA